MSTSIFLMQLDWLNLVLVALLEEQPYNSTCTGMAVPFHSRYWPGMESQRRCCQNFAHFVVSGQENYCLKFTFVIFLPTRLRPDLAKNLKIFSTRRILACMVGFVLGPSRLFSSCCSCWQLKIISGGLMIYTDGSMAVGCQLPDSLEWSQQSQQDSETNCQPSWKKWIKKIRRSNTSLDQYWAWISMSK